MTIRTAIRRLIVRPYGKGWRLASADCEHLVFANSAGAERYARSLAHRSALDGHDAAVEIYDACDLLVGKITFYGCEPLAEGVPDPHA